MYRCILAWNAKDRFWVLFQTKRKAAEKEIVAYGNKICTENLGL